MLACVWSFWALQVPLFRFSSEKDRRRGEKVRDCGYAMLQINLTTPALYLTDRRLFPLFSLRSRSSLTVFRSGD